MDALKLGKFRLAALLAVSMLAIGIAGCEGDDGDNGAAGPAGADGAEGPAGLACWDLNENGIADLPDEDLNGDGVVDVLDCNALANLPPGGGGAVEQFHKAYFTENTYEGTDDCLACHGPIGQEILTTGHWNWEGQALGIEGLEDGTHGKTDIINNFCVAVPTNEGRCTQCHIGIGWNGPDFDFADPSNIDCLVCHDQTGTYVKAPPSAGAPPPDLDLQPIAQSVAVSEGRPSRDNCMACHGEAGGADNVKHPDLPLDIANTTTEYDVHMGTDGLDFDCLTCHNSTEHGIGGMAFHSNLEGNMKTCTDCHGSAEVIHAGKSVESIVNSHTTLACQVCHIPTAADIRSTKVYWDWSTAGDADRVPQPDPNDPTRFDYDKKKGDFLWEFNIRPVLLYQERTAEDFGKWEKMVVNETDGFTELPAVLGRPAGDRSTPGAMIYPFKQMFGKQPADAINDIVLVPHLFPGSDGPNAYWKTFEWGPALQDGADQTGQPYSGEYTFVETVNYLSVNHEVAPKEEAYGYGGVEAGACTDCHGAGQIDFTLLGCTDDPFTGGDCP
ncbi:MAG: tetrathionate reductase family octaheme c-type cytochrome [Chromatiales bacterium]|jgi:octaheme c-type cytochrome (tetrathionate reductase family)|nr:tetrathionate reductase family octaheme c-type cytochrome [Chromatiales bacterium]